MNAVQTVLPTFRIEWLEEEVQQEPDITRDVREILDAAMLCIINAWLTTQAKAILGIDDAHFTVVELLTRITNKYTDKSDERQDELRLVTTKIKMKSKCTVRYYVTKHHIVRRDILHAQCNEIIQDTNQKVTMQHILNGLRDDPEWYPFISAYKMFKNIKGPESIDELEEWMLEDER